MFIRPCYRRIKGKRQPYWALVESYRTDRGPRQRTVAWLGRLKQSERDGVKLAAQGKQKSPYAQLQLFDDEGQIDPEWVEIDTANVRVENQLEFGGAWLALELIHQLRLDDLFEIRRRCVARPTEHQAILLDRLGLRLPRQLKVLSPM